MSEPVSLVGEVSENPLHTPLPFSSRAHFAKVRGRPLAEGGSTQGRITDCTDHSDRWRIVCRLLVDPERESRRLARLLEALPAERRRHEIPDDCMRRPGAGRRAAADPPASISGGCNPDTGRSPRFRYPLT